MVTSGYQELPAVTGPGRLIGLGVEESRAIRLRLPMP